jgi:AcrR family transcriptional regulator
MDVLSNVRNPMDADTARTKLLDAAEDLFYRRGVQAVGMDDIRSASGVSLKRLYQLYPAKESLVQAFLQRRDIAWRGRVAAYVDEHAFTPRDRVLAVFDWLHVWFSEPGYRGCAWINTFGELGGTSTAVANEARAHKAAFRAYLLELAAAAGGPDSLGDQLLLLAEGAITTAAISGKPEPARQARAAAERLMAT